MRCGDDLEARRKLDGGGDGVSNRLFLLREFASIVRDVRADSLPVGQVQAEQSAAGAEGGQRADPADGVETEAALEVWMEIAMRALLRVI